MLLVGDVGGTKTRVALYTTSEFGATKGFTRTVVETYDSRNAPSLSAILNIFLDKHTAREQVAHACFGIPGPVVDGRVKTTNLPWMLDEQEIAREVKLSRCKLVNDLAATAAALPYLAPADLVVLHPGSRERDQSVYGICAPGTGLGIGFLIKDSSGGLVPLPSEGGHQEFAPTNETEIELLRYLRQKMKKRISAERVICGPGLVNIYNFLKDTGRCEEPAELREKIEQSGDAARVISESGLAGRYEISARTLEIFSGALGSIAGDLVLTLLTTAGMFLGGGIPPKIVELLQRGTAVQAYLNKGRLAPLVQATPLYVIKDDHVALLGAAALADRLR